MKEILVVDDDIQIGNVMEKVLSEEGYAVSRAYSGTEVLLFLKGHRPDLILLDLMLPGFSGEEILRYGYPVIVISAKTETDSKVKLLLGARRII